MAGDAVKAKLHPVAPTKRTLRVFAFDPQASIEVDTAPINDTIVALPWEASWEDSLAPGPVNEYIEVVDYDPYSGCFYPPVDLDAPLLLAQDGLAPSDSNPQFHQQMVFAVAMKTIRSFERALGRLVFWMRESDSPPSDDKPGDEKPGRFREYVRRLRIYPHAMRADNAYYSPQKTALLFGYFRGQVARDGTGGGWVFTCLSQDIIAHETAHAILHGMWPRSIEASNPDTLAFHEAFADIVALLQHFSSPEIVTHQLGRGGGSLRAMKLLGSLAQQFGRATGRDGPLRSAMKMVIDEEAALLKGETLKPDRHAGITEPHKRGQILVAAVFDTVVTIYDRRTADLLRLAGRRRGDTDLPPELVARLAEEAARAAEQVLRMCIRGLDYLPPVDVTFGEYLRAIVTADADLVPDDPCHYRVAIAEAFRKRGVTIDTNHFSSTDSLIWDEPEPFLVRPGARPGSETADASFSDLLSKLVLTVTYDKIKIPEGTDAWHREKLENIVSFRGADAYSKLDKVSGRDVVNRNLRDLSMHIVQFNALVMHQWLIDPDERDADWETLLGIKILPTELRSIYAGKGGRPKIEVHSVRISRRQGPEGETLQQLVVQVTQRRRGYYSGDTQAKIDSGEFGPDSPEARNPDFTFRGGSTFLVDLNDGRIRRVVRKRIDDNRRLARHRGFLLGDPDAFTFDGRSDTARNEPFAFVHGMG